MLWAKLVGFSGSSQSAVLFPSGLGTRRLQFSSPGFSCFRSTSFEIPSAGPPLTKPRGSPGRWSSRRSERDRRRSFDQSRVKRIAIFLSVFDVHVNRAPIAGKITHSEATTGRFLDARNPSSAEVNARRTWAIQGKGKTVVVRQITGAIARRICAWKKVGDSVERGERFGMIRFGSRTEVDLPLEAEILVKLRERVRGGETPIARLSPKQE